MSVCVNVRISKIMSKIMRTAIKVGAFTYATLANCRTQFGLAKTESESLDQLRLTQGDEH